LMFEEIDNRFALIEDIAKASDLSLDLIRKAYLKAKDLHKNQLRKDGTPYISHPVEVALILAKLGFDENVISGALLHDTIEDCGYSSNQMKKDFNETIFKLVDCVSAIDNSKYVFDKENIFEDPVFVKSSAEEQTFKKLISLGKDNPCGFAIKFADRLHNLRTISTFDYSKQLEKVRETEKWVLPIAKALQSEYFYRAIKNECFKIVNQFSGQRFFEHYNVYHNSNKKNVDQIYAKLSEVFADSLIKDIRIKNVREYKVFEDLTRLYKKIDISKISQGQILKVANYNIYMLYSNASQQQAVTEFLNRLSSKTNLKVIDVNVGTFTNKVYFQVEDEFKNKYNFYILSESVYSIVKVGTVDGQNLDKIDEENINDLDVDLIRIKTRSGEIKYIAKNSTVLDFAFKLHKDIGFAFKYAIINGGKTKFPPYTKINENDKIEIITEKDDNGNLKNNAQLKWLAYVNSEYAKKVLIKWLEKMM
ncbi:MAG: HD domain-containing protein, partial [Christensenellales bacterium]